MSDLKTSPLLLAKVREYVAAVLYTAGSPAYLKQCNLLAEIDAALRAAPAPQGEVLASAIDSPTVEALAKVFDPRHQRPDKSYSEQIVEILAPRLALQRCEAVNELISFVAGIRSFEINLELRDQIITKLMTLSAPPRCDAEATPAMVAAGIEACEGRLHARTIRMVWTAMARRAAPAPQGRVDAATAELLEILDEEGRDGHGACKVAAETIRALLAEHPRCDAECRDADLPTAADVLGIIPASPPPETQSTTEIIEAIREIEVPWLVKELGDSIANMPYPVGMGMAPHPEHLQRAAERLFERWTKMAYRVAHGVGK
jgi:hypothetical protein